MCRRTLRTFLRVTTGAAVVAALLAVTAPAGATGSHRFDLVADTYPSVYGAASGTFESEVRVGSIAMYVKDRACDSSDVYVRFLVFYRGGAWETDERRGGEGCGRGAGWDGLYIHDGRGITGVQLEACVDSAGSDECAYSVVARNPYLPEAEIPQQLVTDTIRRFRDTHVGADGVNSYEGEIT